jgi:hypothetical protein
MLSANEWWEIIKAYGAAVWPAQAIFFAGGLLLVLLVFMKPGRAVDALTRLYLTISLGWVGIVFFMVLGKGLAGNYFFGSLFTIAAALFAVDLFRRKMHFELPKTPWQRYTTTALALAVICYPVVSLAFGHHFPGVIVPGSHPCPSAALGLVLLTMALPRVNKVAYIILLFWAIPFPPAIQIPKYGVYEDTIMFVVGLYALVMLIRNWKPGATVANAAETTSQGTLDADAR